MKKHCVVLVTGAAGDAQGWGDMRVTCAVRDAIIANDLDCRIVEAENRAELEAGLAAGDCSIVWSALYFFSDRSDIIGIPPNAVWVADVLDELKIPYIGPSAQTMKNLIGKFTTHEILARNNVSVPEHILCPPCTADDVNYFPAFVKPDGESRSVGINEKSVAEDHQALAEQIRFIQQELQQAALVEEYLPGKEYTVMVIGNGDGRKILPGCVTVDPAHYGKYPVLRSDLRGVGLTKVSIQQELQQEAADLAAAACDALNCSDHVRIDMRVGSDGKLRIMEVNGIPGLKPVKSWSPQIFNLYYPGENSYQELIGTIVKCALERSYGK